MKLELNWHHHVELGKVLYYIHRHLIYMNMDKEARYSLTEENYKTKILFNHSELKKCEDKICDLEIRDHFLFERLIGQIDVLDFTSGFKIKFSNILHPELLKVINPESALNYIEIVADLFEHDVPILRRCHFTFKIKRELFKLKLFVCKDGKFHFLDNLNFLDFSTYLHAVYELNAFSVDLWRLINKYTTTYKCLEDIEIKELVSIVNQSFIEDSVLEEKYIRDFIHSDMLICWDLDDPYIKVQVDTLVSQILRLRESWHYNCYKFSIEDQEYILS